MEALKALLVQKEFSIRKSGLFLSYTCAPLLYSRPETSLTIYFSINQFIQWCRQ